MQIAAVKVLASLVVAACGAEDRSFVEVLYFGPGFTPPLERAVLADLDAGLDARGFDACDARTAARGGAIARVELIASSTIAVLIRAEVFGATASKDLERDVALDRVTADGRALAIAVSIDELVRAGLDELSMSKRAWVREKREPPPPKKEELPKKEQPKKEQPKLAAPEPRQVPAEEPVLAETELAEPIDLLPRRSSFFAGVRGMYESYGGGLSYFGAELYARVKLASWLGVEASGGTRFDDTRALESGTISARAWSFALAPMLMLVPIEDGLEVSLFAGTRASMISYRGTATLLGASAARASGLALYAEGGVALSLAIVSQLRLEARALAGAPLRAFTAREGQRNATGASGIELSGSTGIAWGF